MSVTLPAQAGSMDSMVEDNTRKPIDKSRRAVILATVGIVVILGLAVFYVAVVAPPWETHRVVRKFAPDNTIAFPYFGGHGEKSPDAVARLGGPERAADRLAAYLRLPRWMKADRYRATYLLGWCGPCAVPPLTKTLCDADAYVRRYAAWALGKNGSDVKAAVSALVKALRDTNADVREETAKALGKIGPEAKAAVPALVKALGDRNWRVRYCAASALGFIGREAKEAVPALKRLLKDSDASVHSAAAEALKKIRGEL